LKVSTVMNIEVATVCTRSCRYCPNYKIKGKRPDFISPEIFAATLKMVDHFVKAGTQRELTLVGMGESTLHPSLPSLIRQARSILPLRCPLTLITNAWWVDRSSFDITPGELEYARELKDAGLSRIDISGHVLFDSIKAGRILKALGIPGTETYEFAVHPHDWAGQVDWFRADYTLGPCPWITNGQAYIATDGSILNCCIDVHGISKHGNVLGGAYDYDFRPFDLCSRCHHTV
jgi:hypothetical protein